MPTPTPSPSPQGPRSKQKAKQLYATSYANTKLRETLTPIYYGRIPQLSQIPVTVIPMPSQSAAKALARWWNLGEEDKVEMAATVLANHSMIKWADSSSNLRDHYRWKARAILALLTGNQPKGKRK